MENEGYCEEFGQHSNRRRIRTRTTRRKRKVRVELEGALELEERVEN